MKYLRLWFLVLVSTLLSGCFETLAPVRLVPCGQDLKPEVFQACLRPAKLAEGTSFEKALESRLDLKAELEKCEVRRKLLEDTLRACNAQVKTGESK